MNRAKLLALISAVVIVGGGIAFVATASAATSGAASNQILLSCQKQNKLFICTQVNTPPSTTTVVPTTTVRPTTTTALPSTTTTVPPTSSVTVTTPPPVGDWPTAADTGSTGALTDVTPPTGELILDTNNQVFTNMRVHGTVTVEGCNVTLKNIEVDDGEAYNGDATPDDFLIWDKAPENCTTTIDNVSVVTPSGQYATEAIRDAYGATQNVDALKATGQQLGITLGDSDTIKDSYILLASTLRGDHNEDILEDGDSGVTLEHNTFLNPNGQTSALSLFNEFSANKNFLVEDNLLAGGGYTCYCGDGVDAHASNISFVNNVFWELYFPSVGNFGPGRAYRADGGGQWTGNVYMLKDGTLTTQTVSQPPVDQ